MPETTQQFRPLEDVEKLRLAAEAKKFEAEAQKAEFESKLFEAQTVEAEHRSRTAEEEHKQYVLNTEAGRIQVDEAKRREMEVLAANVHNYVYAFNDSVSASSVKKCIDALTIWSRNAPGCDIEITINSGGGDVVEGFALIDFIFGLRKKGHKITITAYGMAASMAGVILQAADVRQMGSNAILLIHEGSLGAVGNFGEVEDRVKLMELFHEKILDLFVERSVPKVTKAFIRKRWARTDWWISSEISKELGLVDEII